MSDDVIDGKHILSSAQDAALRASFALSDSVAFSGKVPPLAKELRNVYDMDVGTLALDSAPSAISCLLGFLTSGCLASAFLTQGGAAKSLPNLTRLAGNLTGGVIHCASAALGTNAHCIDSDSSDVVSARGTGCAILASSNAQESYDLALIAHLAALKTKIPFLHLYESENGSYEIRDVSFLPTEKLTSLIDESAVRAFRENGISSEKNTVCGTVMDSSLYFQSIEAVNRYYSAFGEILQREMDKFAKLTGRQYNPFDFAGSKEALKLIIIMGAGADTVSDTVEYLNKKGEKTAVIKVRLYRPFNAKNLMNIIPKTVRFISVLDNSKEAGSDGEALYKDVCSAIAESGRRFNAVLGGRYALGGKTFTSASVAAIFDNMTLKGINHFTVGITDDVEKSSLPIDKNFNFADRDVTETVFYGTAASSSRSAKELVSLFKELKPAWNVCAYYKAFLNQYGSPTLLTLRTGGNAKSKQYPATAPDFVIVGQCRFAEMYDVLQGAREGATLLLNAQYSSDDVWNHLPIEVQKHIIERRMGFYIIDAAAVAEKESAKIDDIMLLAYFKICKEFSESDVIEILDEPFRSISQTVFSSVREIMYPNKTGKAKLKQPFSKNAAPFIRDILSEVEAFRGDKISVGKLNENGEMPRGVSRYQKRAVIAAAPVWDAGKCSQCGECALFCPRACISMKLLPALKTKHIPKEFPMTSVKPVSVAGKSVTLQISIDDCIACRACEDICKENAIHFEPLTAALKETLHENYEYFQKLPAAESQKTETVRDLAFARQYFEFSSTAEPSFSSVYIKLIAQLYGTRAVFTGAPLEIASLVAGCAGIALSSDEDERGIAWNTSTMAEAAQFLLSLRTSYDIQRENAKNLAERVLVEGISVNSVRAVLDTTEENDEQREKLKKAIVIMKKYLSKNKNTDALFLASVAESFLHKCFFLFCTRIWSEQDGFFGLTEVFASKHNVNIVVLCEKSVDKCVDEIAMTYKDIYVAAISIGADYSHAISTIKEAERYDGVSIIFADCRWDIAAQKSAVENGDWILFRYNPQRASEKKNPLTIDSAEPKNKDDNARYKTLSYIAERKW